MSVVHLIDVCLLLLLSSFSPPLVKGLTCTDTRQFGETYVLQLSLASDFHGICYSLNSTTQSEAIHVFVESEGALVQHPVLVTVKQPRGVRAWSLPHVDSGFAYRSVDRTLCPLLNIVDSGEPIIRVDLSTTSKTPLNITLRLTTVANYKIQLNTPVMLSASPSRPSYLLFDYPPDVTRVRVKFTSTDDTSGICAIASLQTAYCPEVELVNNREARGTYQTLRSIASINAAEHARGSNFGYFYVVLTVFPNNGREDNCDFKMCDFNEMVMLENNAQNYNPMPSIGEERVKRVNITIEPALTDTRYYIVMGVTLGLFSLFYLITYAWIIVFDWWKYDTSPKYSILKRGQSVFLESNLENVSSPLKSSKRKHSQQFKFDSVEDNDEISERVLPNEDKEDQSGSSVKDVSRPTLLSVMIGVHWKHSIKKASKKSSTPTENKLPDPHHPSPTPLSEATPIPTPHSETTPSTTPHPETTPSTTPHSETTPSTTPHSETIPSTETTSSKALVHQSSVPPIVRHRHVTPLITEAMQKTEIDVGGGSDPGPSTADKHVQFSQAGTGGVPERKAQSYKYDTSAFPVQIVLSELGEIDEYQKVFDLYPVFILVCAVFYTIPAVQLVLTFRWLTGSGNEDICYYNNLCSHPWETSGGLTFSAFNNLFSNIGYFALGLLLILIARRRRRMYEYYVNRNYTRAPKYRFGVPQQFGLFYAMGMAMMAEAVLSTVYHVCPTRDNFSFDITFMNLVPTLGFFKLAQSRNPDQSPGMRGILIYLSIIVVGVVVGTVSSDNHIFWPIVFIVQTILSLVMAVQLYYRFQIENQSLRKLFAMYWNEGIFPPRHKPKFVLAILTLILNWGFAIYGLVLRPSKFGLYVLDVFLANFGMYLIYYIATKRFFNEIKSLKAKTVAFSIAAVLCFTIGIYFYALEPTDWNLSPAVSREKNIECVLFGFYDVHDIWHFMSGFGVFFSGLVLMTMDDKQEVWARRRLLVF